jgi:hypothetical protein
MTSVIFSRTSATALFHVLNIVPDCVLRLLRDNDGIIMALFVSKLSSKVLSTHSTPALCMRLRCRNRTRATAGKPHRGSAVRKSPSAIRCAT